MKARFVLVMAIAVLCAVSPLFANGAAETKGAAA